MIMHEVAQYSAEWLVLAAGVPSASHFSEIYTRGGKPSSSQEAYIDQLIAESYQGQREVNGYVNAAMERGLELEPEAMRWFEFRHDGRYTLRHGGWITNDSGTAGLSADFIVTDTATGEVAGGLELKCPEGKHHVGYLRQSESVANKYLPQVQGSLAITGWPRWWTLSYHPRIPAALHVVEPDPVWIGGFMKELVKFQARLAAAKALLVEQGYPFPQENEHGEEEAAE